MLGLVFGFLAALTAILYIPLQEYKVDYANHNGCISNNMNSNKDHN